MTTYTWRNTFKHEWIYDMVHASLFYIFIIITWKITQKHVAKCAFKQNLGIFAETCASAPVPKPHRVRGRLAAQVAGALPPARCNPRPAGKPALASALVPSQRDWSWGCGTILKGWHFRFGDAYSETWQFLKLPCLSSYLSEGRRTALWVMAVI